MKLAYNHKNPKHKHTMKTKNLKSIAPPTHTLEFHDTKDETPI